MARVVYNSNHADTEQVEPEDPMQAACPERVASTSAHPKEVAADLQEFEEGMLKAEDAIGSLPEASGV